MVALGKIKTIRAVPFALLGLVLGARSSAQQFNAFVLKALATPEGRRQAVVDSFLRTLPSAPVIEADTLVHFVYAGGGSRVTLAGDMNQWDPNAWPLKNIPGTNFWYRTASFEKDARLDYKFVVDGSTWLLDPRNPYQIRGGFGPNSELRMPGYIPPPEIEYRADIPHGSLHDTVLTSTYLGNSRLVRVYTPPGYEAGAELYPLLLVHDGLDYINLAQAPNVLDNLIAEGRIQPLVAVFVPPVDRNPEYAGGRKAAFSHFIVDELMPYLYRRYRVRREANAHAVLGASNGGNISLYLAVHYPDVFANVAAQSSNVEAEISSALRDGPTLPLRFYLDLGTYDIPLLIRLVRELVLILQARGYPLRYAEYHEGHSWGNWRAHLDDALEFFFPGPALGVGDRGSLPARFALLEAYPNPTRAHSRIAIRTEGRESFELVLYDLQGRCVRIWREDFPLSAEHTLTWDGRDSAGVPVPSGVYICRLSTPGGRSATARIVLLR
ncbi:MAG: alpha/beta hydrolase-fold protein [candidate division KSB1 bacterium]|nr:alpha/beta hydrolase-fold protein [candidate division KSB1 bacterium]